MAAAVQHLEEILKEYLLFRGFTNTLKAFEGELKADKDKSFRVFDMLRSNSPPQEAKKLFKSQHTVNKIVEQLMTFVTVYDLQGIREYWSYLRRRFFTRLDSANLTNAQKLEKCLYRFYLVNAVQTSRPDMVTDFFEKMAPELQSQQDWKEWFVLPFLKNPEHNSNLEMYFSQLWQETFPLSLHNFLNAIFQSMPLPRLLKFDAERIMSDTLRQDNNLLHQEILKLQQEISILQGDKVEKKTTTKDGDIQRLERPKVTKSKEKEANFIQRRFRIKNKEQQEKEDIQPHQGIVPTESLQQQEETTGTTVVDENKDFDDVPPIKRVISGAKVDELHETNTHISEKEISKTEEDASMKSSSETNPPVKTSESQRNDLDHVADPNLHGKRSLSLSSKTLPRITSPKRSLSVRSHSARELVSITSFTGDDTKEDSGPFLMLSQETFCEHRSAIVQCDFSASGKLVASVDSDGIVKVWKHHPSPTTVATVMSKSSILSIEWAKKTDKVLLLGTNNGKIRLYDTETKTNRCDVSTDSNFTRVVSLASSPSGTSFVCSAIEDNRSSMSSVLKHALSTEQERNIESSKQGTLLVWDLKTMKLERHLPLGINPIRINCIAYNHNGTLLVTGGSDGMIRVYDTRTYDCLMSWTAHQAPVSSVQFSIDETSVFSMGRDKQFSQWSLHTGSRTASLATHEGMCGPQESLLTGRTKNVLFSRLFTFDCTAEHLLTCAPTSGTIYKYNSLSENSLCQVFSIGGHKSHVTSVDWSTTGDFVTCLTGSMSGHICMTKLLKR